MRYYYVVNATILLSSSWAGKINTPIFKSRRRGSKPQGRTPKATTVDTPKMDVPTLAGVAQYRMTKGFRKKIDVLFDYIDEKHGVRFQAPPQPDQHDMQLVLTEAQYDDIKELTYGKVNAKTRSKRFSQFLVELGLRHVRLTAKHVTLMICDVKGWNDNAYRLTSAGRQPGGKPIIQFYKMVKLEDEDEKKMQLQALVTVDEDPTQMELEDAFVASLFAP
jgi:hypothetical protein